MSMENFEKNQTKSIEFLKIEDTCLDQVQNQRPMKFKQLSGQSTNKNKKKFCFESPNNMAIVKYPTLPEEKEEISKIENIQPTFEQEEKESSDEEKCKENWEKMKDVSKQLMSLFVNFIQLGFTKLASKFLKKPTTPKSTEITRIEELQKELEMKSNKIKRLTFYLILFSLLIVLLCVIFHFQRKSLLSIITNQFSKDDHFYSTLKVDPTANYQQIDNAFIQLFSTIHYHDEKQALKRAYSVLSDVNRRSQYHDFLNSSSSSCCSGVGCFMFIATISCLIFALILRCELKK
jgi:hypothetical protein